MSEPAAKENSSLSDGVVMDLRLTYGYHNANLMIPKRTLTGLNQNARQIFQNMGEYKSTSYITLTKIHNHMTFS
jgi:hypothetical protein